MSRGGEQLKVSEVAGLIDQIQAGSSSNISEFTLKKVTYRDEDITEFNQKQKEYSYEMTGDLVVDYEYTGRNYETSLIFHAGSSVSFQEKEVKKGSNSITFKNVSTETDGGRPYILIVNKPNYGKTDVVFSVNLYNDSSEF